MEYLNDLYELCDIISRKVREATEKIRSAGGELSGGDVEYVDKLTHTLKSIKTTIAMMEAEDGRSNRDGYNGNYNGGTGNSYKYGYNSGYYYDGNSMARGRNARRDSMGRYSGHPDRQEAMEHLRMAMESAPDEETQQKIERVMGSMNG